ncbi:hypothetical protein [Luteibacter aegosomatissinici]|uniref:hypothetical protein n=1 Tax=Luteibacter aegosomatissinici TaxID=2911539 RepID=UPI001FF76678|nr:hypothetical protein [Luteibacter aegosomatissinici]UPG94036.1 hypothetical protein L2Y97_19785 [Luteibacter aegosomatissinici]
MHDETASLVTRLLAQRWLPRDDAQARKALLDEAFREDLDRRLEAVGLELREHPYAAYIGLAVARRSERAVFGGSDSWISNTMQLDRDGVALLVVIWALIVLPKRQRQVERQEVEAKASQGQMFAEEKPIPRDPTISPVIAERTLLADFAEKLGGKTRVNFNLGTLNRLGFIVRRKGEVAEGPLLDLAFDYERTARRILDGALGDLLADAATRATNTPVSDTDDEPLYDTDTEADPEGTTDV